MRLSILLARHGLTSAALLAGASACLFGAASCSKTAANPPNDAGPEGASGGFVPEVACVDTRDSIYDGGTSVFQDSLDGATGAPLDPARRGDIVRCEQENDIPLGDLQDQSTQDGHVGRSFVSGAFEYRVLYRTWRGTGGPDSSAPTIGVSSAVVFVPDHPAAQRLPTIVISRGTSGQGGVCTPTATDPVGEDIRLMAYPLVGAGYVVIAPDLAGYAEYGAPGNPPSGYAAAVDVGQSTIDGARALKKMFSRSVTSDTVLVGHSQGGHTTLSALALADSYAKKADGSADVNIAGAVVYAPLWLSQRSWGALFFEADQYSIAQVPLVNAISIWYHYTNGELMNPGHGLDVFKPEKQDGVKKFVDDDCDTSNAPDLQALGTTVKDIFTQDFQNQITLPAAVGEPCADDAGLCDQWIARYAADRPHLTGSAAQIPILLEYGANDTTIPPERMACVLDRLGSDQVNLTTCVDPSADHSGVVRNQADYVTDWIASKTLGAQAPAACALGAEAITEPDGGPAVCATPPPND